MDTTIRRIGICFALLFSLLIPIRLFAQRQVGGEPVTTGIWKGKTEKYITGEIAVELKNKTLSTQLSPAFGQFHAKVMQNFDKLGWGLIKIPDSLNVAQVISALKKNPVVITAEPNFVTHVHIVLPNDPYFNGTSPATYHYQWALQNTGQTPPGGTNGADIDATDAWNITMGNSNVIIAILDTGIPMENGSLSHPDLDNTNRIILGNNYAGGSQGVRDLYGHGTHVAGIAAAETNNSKGIAGVAGNCKILVERVFDAYGHGSDYNFYEGVENAVDYAINHPNDKMVINFSGGGGPPSSNYESAINYANSHNVTIVVSAGNDSTQGVEYPAAYSTTYPNVIAVAATDQNDTHSSYSAIGSQLDLSAPGGWGVITDGYVERFNTTGDLGMNIYSATPNYPFNIQTDPEYQGDPYSTDVTQNYGYLAGTSMAAPMVSGTVALMLTVNPSLTPSEIRDDLENNADKVSGMNGQNFTNEYGYGRLNAYKAVKAILPVLPATITSNTTLSGKYYRVDQNVNVENDATLTIPAGVHLFLSPGVEIIDRPGSKIIANGTSSQPIRFERLDPGSQWNTIALQGNDNQFTWTLFDGGNKNVSVRSTNNTFDDCTFRNGSQGISSGANYSGGGNSSFSMTDCMVENNSSTGVVAYYSNVSLTSTTIQNNGGVGLYLYNSSSNNFFRNAFISSETSDGMEVLGGSDITFPPSALNLIANNYYDQIQVGAGSSLTMGDPNLSESGYNSVYGGSRFLINNQSSTTVGAYGNWWGSSNPPSYVFSGPVDYSGYLSYDPCVEIGGCGVSSGQYPNKAAPDRLQLMVEKNTASESPSESPEKPVQSGNNTSASSILVSKSEYRKKRRALMHSLWSAITNDYNAKRLLSEMHELYRLDLISRGDTSFTRERKTDRLLWRSMIQKYLNGDQVQNAGGVQLSASEVASLMIMDEHEAQRFGKYTEAGKKVDEYTHYITGPHQKVALEIDRMNLMHEQGNYKQALAMLDNVEQEEITLGTSPKRVHALYKIAQNNMQQAIKEQQLARAGNQNGKIMTATASTRPDKTKLQSNYPNPFNPTTNIRYELAKPEAVRLTVYNVLGQQIAVLVHERQMAGWHQAVFNALNLSSGLYFYRLRAGNKVLVKKMLLLK